MKTMTRGLGLALLATPLWAHAGSAVSTLPEPPGLAVADELADEYEALVDALGAARQAFFKKLNEAEGEERDRIYAEENPTRDYLARFQDLARRAGTSEVAFEAWLWVLGNADDKDPRTQALTQLLADHLTSVRLGEVAEALNYAWHELGRERVEGALERIALESPHRAVQAAGWYGVARLYMAYDESEPALEAARKVRDDYGSEAVAARAARLLYELETLQVGMLAPDFSAVDQVGVEFKLSDYRGKVVLLDFWGFW